VKVSTKIVQLKARADYPDLDLAKGESYYPATSADAVKGLDEVVDGKVVKYDPATETADGLMSSVDKKKLNKLKEEPLSELEFKSPNGSIFVVSVDDDGKLSAKAKGGS
jgi:hypothetical protein